MPFPYDLPFDFEFWHTELVVIESALACSVTLDSPLDQIAVMLCPITKDIDLRSGISPIVELPSPIRNPVDLIGRL